MFDKIISLILLLNLTGLFSFIAPHFNVDIAAVSLVLLILNCLYLAVNHKVARRIFRKKHIFYWFIFLLFWPLLATIYAPAINFRELGLQVYYFTLLLAVVVYLLRNGFESFHRIITIAIAITVAGLILSMFKSEYFQSVASIIDNRLAYQSRAYGFFMQPNLAALNSILLFIAWFAVLRKPKIFTVLLSSVGLLVLVTLTGSRGGFVMAVAVISLIFINKSIRVRKPLTILISPKSIITFLLVSGCFLACIPLLLSFLTANLPKHIGNFDVIARINAMSQMKLTEKDSKNKSTVTKRLQVLKQYSAMVCEHPILGNGFGSTTILQDKGLLGRSSHNQYLKIAFETGIFRLAFYLLLLLSIYVHPRRKRIERLLHTNSYAQLLMVVMLASMVSNTVLDSRVLYCIMGCFIAMLIFPQTITANVAVKENTQSSKYTGSPKEQNEK